MKPVLFVLLNNDDVYDGCCLACEGSTAAVEECVFAHLSVVFARFHVLKLRSCKMRMH